MIHTDGLPTISNAPSRRPTVDDAIAAIPKEAWEETTLLERDGAGLNVRVHYSDGAIWLLVADSDGPHIAVIPPDKVLDAFEHPYVYLAR